ncbi:MAG: hypothetical protein GX907_03595 [Clostridiaceae bacterium]|nr:hypothetical protein [Clostridiaceae bacterium]
MANKFLVGFSAVELTPDKRIYLQGQFYKRISTHVQSPLLATAMAIRVGDDQAVICSCDLTSIAVNLMAEIRAELVKQGLPEQGLDIDKIIVTATHTHTSFKYRADAPIESTSSNSMDISEGLLPPGFYMVYDEETAEIPTDEQGNPLELEATGDFSRPGIMDDDESLAWIAERVARAIAEAWQNCKPMTLVSGFGRAPIGMCRRVVYNDGSAKMWGFSNTATFEELEGGNDSGIELIYCIDEADNLAGIVANICCPSQIMEHRLSISSDYWGETRRRLYKRFGPDLKLVGLGGPGGDQCPRDLVRWIDPETKVLDPNINHPKPSHLRADPSMFDESGLRTAGRRIATEIIAIYEELREDKATWEARVQPAVLRHEVDEVLLPLRRVTPEEISGAKQSVYEYCSKLDRKGINYRDRAELYVHIGILRRAALQEEIDLFGFEGHFLRIGNLAMATNPFELFLNYGNKIRARSMAEQTFLLQLTCGTGGYLPTKKGEEGGHYSAYVASGYVGHEGGDALVRETLSRLRAIWEKE